MEHVFISYSSRHRDLTQDFSSLLKGEGYAVWWDRELETWGEYEPQIREAIDAAAVVVVIWSDGAVKSRFVKAEVEKAMRLGRLVNLRAPDFPLDEVPLNYASVDHILTLELDDPAPILKSLRTVWEGKVPVGARPAREFYREQYDEDLFGPRRRALPEDPAMVTPSVLLQAPFEVADYVDATGILADTLEWCRGTGAHAEAARPTAGRLLYGPGGLGKTRTMIEAVRQLRGEGWLAGFYPAPVPSDPARMKLRHRAIEQAMAATDLPGILMVLDYAEMRGADVIELSRMARRHDRSGLPPLRIVLLSRGDGWWQDIYRTEPEVQVVFNRRGAPQGDIIVVEPLPVGEARLAAFEAMRAALTPMLAQQAEAGRFPPLTDRPVPSDRRARLAEDPAYARPLALQMEALLSLGGKEGGAVADLLESILGLERKHWRRVIEGLVHDDRREIAMRRGMSQVTALGGVADRRGLQRLLRADEYFGSRAPVDLPTAELRRLYGAAPEGVAPLEPDLIGEHEVLLSGDQDLVDACRAWIAGLPEPDRSQRNRNLITLLQRAARAEHGARALEAEALLSHLVATLTVEEVIDLIAVAIETPGPLAALLTSQVASMSADLLSAMAKALPHQTVALMELADRVAERRLEDARARIDAGAASVEDKASLARQLHVRGVSLSRLGQNEAALPATEEALAIRRQLAEAHPDEHEPDLAQSLNTLGVLLNNLGKPETALAATEEAVAICRRLTASRPEAYEPDLAQSLNNLGVDLSHLGQREEALTASDEAVALYRRLASSRPDTFEPDLAASLNNLGNWLSNLGRWEAALSATEEAVTIHRQLAASRPDAFEPALAQSLSNLGNRLSECGRREAALAAGEEAVAIHRQLAAARPDAFKPALAQSLTSFATWISNLGRPTALAFSEEAVAIYRQLAEACPDAFEPDLAGSLNYLGARLSEQGQREGALAATEEAVSIYRRFAAASPDAFEPSLAESLSNLGVDLLNLGRRKAALAAAEEAVAIRRRIAAARPEAFEPDLVRSLNNLGVHLSDLGRPEAALEATEEAVAIYRRLAAACPDAFEPALAQSLRNLSEHLLQVDRQAESIFAAEEGIALLTPHQVRHPYAHQELMDALNETLAEARAGKDDGEAP